VSCCGLLVVWNGEVVVDVMCWCLWCCCHKLIVSESGSVRIENPMFFECNIRIVESVCVYDQFLFDRITNLFIY